MNQTYKSFKCIRKMPDTCLSSFDDIVKEYGKELNRDIIHENGTVFTLHDFDHHCCDLYQIISDVILYDKVAFGENGITERELYILNLAVLLHDIGMVDCIDFNRDNHSHKSAEKIKKAYKNPKDPLTEAKSSLCRNELSALGRIVQAHSDVKDESIPDEKNGLNDPQLNNHASGGQGQVIRARFLANILRMADELDVTNDRLGKLDVEHEVEKAEIEKKKIRIEYEQESNEKRKLMLFERLKRYEAAVASNKHWKRLHLFKEVKRSDSGVAHLIVDDEYIEEILNQGQAIEKIADEIMEVHNKIQLEFQKFQNDIQVEVSLSAMIAMKDIKVKTQNTELQSQIQNYKKKEEKPIEKEYFKPNILSEEIERKITDFVEKRNLFEVGHFKLHDNLCARDWIMADEVIETNPMFRKCEAQFLLHLSEQMKGIANYLIVGIDFSGMLIASKLAYVLQKPYTYVIPTQKIRSSSVREMEFNVSEYEKIILVTDVIVTFKTIRDIIDKYDISDKVSIIYAVFFRNTEEKKFVEENQDLIKKTYVLNSEFAIETHSNKECRYKDCNECKAFNRRFD